MEAAVYIEVDPELGACDIYLNAASVPEKRKEILCLIGSSVNMIMRNFLYGISL